MVMQMNYIPIIQIELRAIYRYYSIYKNNQFTIVQNLLTLINYFYLIAIK